MSEVPRFFTGVGSRETPAEVLVLMEDIATWFANQGYRLRSGNADGADQAFERGVLRSSCPDAMDIYLPWKSFGQRLGSEGCYLLREGSATWAAARELAQGFIPWWDKLSPGAKTLHTRNVYQVLGDDLETPSEVVIYYAPPAPNGEVKGGTRTAVKVAELNHIPTVNLYHPYNRAIYSRLILS